jgi:hypothetical protein
MFRWLKRAGRHPRTGRKASPVLCVEALETRNCPTAPTLSYTATILNGRNIQLSGTVSDPQPSSCLVTFGGVTTAMVYADTTGHFFTEATATSLGTISGLVTDGQNQTSDEVDQTLSCDPPVLTLTPIYGPNNYVILSGRVSGDMAAGSTVSFTGAVSSSTTTDPTGSFSLVTTNWSPGSVTAGTADVWAQKSNAASATLTNAPPVISNFTASQGSNGLWTFQGEVTDEYAPGEAVRLSGIPTLNVGAGGYLSVTVGSDGWFRLTSQLTSQDLGGCVTAVAYDWTNQASDPAYAYVT